MVKTRKSQTMFEVFDEASTCFNFMAKFDVLHRSVDKLNFALVSQPQRVQAEEKQKTIAKK